MKKPQVAVVMGSDSDLDIVKDAFEMLEKFNIPYEAKILSAHRCPEETHEFASKAYKQGVKVMIAAAGGAAHLAGVIAASFPLPVIGIPIKTSTLNGIDSLYSIVQMPTGVPVATVAINGATNAALLAIEILAVFDEKLAEKFIKYKQDMREAVLKKSQKLEQAGYKKYHL